MKLNFKGFDWDKGNITKCKKHGLSIKNIESMFLNKDLFITPDIKHSDKEDRLIAIGIIKGRPALVIFTRREPNLIRPVSARYMHKKEIKYYEEKNSSF